MVSFGPIAAYYDDLMAKVPYRMWASYYSLLLAHQAARPKELLDVCCGTGRVAELLFEEGYDVWGFDLSVPMIEVAKQRAKDRELAIEYRVADAATVELGRTFDAAFSFFDSLNYITDPEHLRLAIRQVAKHLRPGGSFIFDLNTSYAFEAKLFDQQDTKETAPIQYNWVGSYDPATLLIRVDMEFWVNGDKFEEVHCQRAHPDQEVRAYLKEAGFIDVRAFDSYTLNKPRKKSDRIHYTALMPE